MPAEGRRGGLGFMPTPRAAAIAVMAMLAFGVVIGSATSQLAQSAGLSSILLEVRAAAGRRANRSKNRRARRIPNRKRRRRHRRPTSSDPAVAEVALPGRTAARRTAAGTRTRSPVRFEEEAEAGLPEVKHVFLIVLGENGYEETFGTTSTAPYLSQDAARRGRAAAQLLRGDQGRPGQPDRADQRPGADPGNGGELPQLHRHRAGDRIGDRRTGRRQPAASTRRRPRPCPASWSPQN